jgi:hypothetical protein
VQQESRNHDTRYPDSQRIVWATEESASGQVACYFGVLWKVKSWKICIWIRDTAKFEMPMEQKDS